MVAIRETDQTSFLAKIRTIENAVGTKGKTLDDNLDVVSKWNLNWLLLSLAHPFFSLFGVDLFLHFRVNQVVKNLQIYCEKNARHMDSTVTAEIAKKIITPLSTKTKGKCATALNAVLARTIKVEAEKKLQAEKAAQEKKLAKENAKLFQTEMLKKIAEYDEEIKSARAVYWGGSESLNQAEDSSGTSRLRQNKLWGRIGELEQKRDLFNSQYKASRWKTSEGKKLETEFAEQRKAKLEMAGAAQAEAIRAQAEKTEKEAAAQNKATYKAQFERVHVATQAAKSAYQSESRGSRDRPQKKKVMIDLQKELAGWQAKYWNSFQEPWAKEFGASLRKSWDAYFQAEEIQDRADAQARAQAEARAKQRADAEAARQQKEQQQSNHSDHSSYNSWGFGGSEWHNAYKSAFETDYSSFWGQSQAERQKEDQARKAQQEEEDKINKARREARAASEKEALENPIKDPGRVLELLKDVIKNQESDSSRQKDLQKQVLATYATFRKLRRLWQRDNHPDKAEDKPTAETKFKDGNAIFDRFANQKGWEGGSKAFDQ